MLVSKVLERTPSISSTDNIANRLADRLRNTWLEKRSMDITEWENDFFEDPEDIPFLRAEGFARLQGIDYIFKWWGSSDIDEAAGQLEVLWKVQYNKDITIYKTWIRFADQDFILGTAQSEEQRRELTRVDLRKAFDEWKALYQAEIRAVL